MYLIFSLKNKWNGKIFVHYTNKDLSYGITKLYKEKDKYPNLSMILKIYPCSNFEWTELEKNVPKHKLQETINYWIERLDSRKNGYN